MADFNCTYPILNWRGEAATQDAGPGATGLPDPWQAGKFLAQLLATSEAVKPQDSARAMGLAVMLEQRAAVEFSSAEGVLIGEVLNAAPLAPWIRAALIYLTDPASMEAKERAIMENLYADVESQTQTTGANGAAAENPGSGSL